MPHNQDRTRGITNRVAARRENQPGLALLGGKYGLSDVLAPGSVVLDPSRVAARTDLDEAGFTISPSHPESTNGPA
jgi:hypothetical protein